MQINTCQRCGKAFEAYSSRSRYCRGECYRAHEAECSKRARSLWSEERRRAAIATGAALENGTLVRQPCEVCGTQRYIDAHHDDYSKPLEVRWLCRSHHKQHHIAESKQHRCLGPSIRSGNRPMNSQTKTDKAEALSALRDRFQRAETAEEFAEIALLEAKILGGPFYDNQGQVS